MHRLTEQTLPPILLRIFQELFKVWNGTDSRDAVVNVLTHIPPADFPSLYDSTLQPLEHAILTNHPDTPTAQLVLLDFYTTLLQNWSITIFSSPSLSTLPLPSISSLTSHIHTLSQTLTQTSPTTQTHLQILDFLSTTALLTARPNLLQTLPVTGLIPHPALIYTLTFSHSAAVLSRLCDIITTYKRGLEAVMLPSRRPLTAIENQRVRVFNGFLMDICNCIWRVRAFSTNDTNSQGCHVATEVIGALSSYINNINPEMSLTSAFGLSYNPVLARFALEFMREAEEGLGGRHVGPVSQRSLVAMKGRGGMEMGWQEYKLGVLGYLEDKGFGGVPRLMFNTMKGLMGGKGGVRVRVRGLAGWGRRGRWDGYL